LFLNTRKQQHLCTSALRQEDASVHGSCGCCFIFATLLMQVNANCDPGLP